MSALIPTLVTSRPWLHSAWQQIDAYARRGMPHALLLQGQGGLGKFDLAQALAGMLLCQSDGLAACGRCRDCQLIGAGTHPDLQLLNPEGRLGIDEIRAACRQLQQTPQQGRLKVLVVAGAERMTEPAANAFLKTLEEPPGNAHILMSCDRPEQLLATIRSRCQRVLIGKPSQAELTDWLGREAFSQPSQDQVELAVVLAQGAPVPALALLEGEGLAQGENLLRLLLELRRDPALLGETAQWLAERGDQGLLWLQSLFYLGLGRACGRQGANLPQWPELAYPHWLELIARCQAIIRARAKSSGVNTAMQLLPLLQYWQQLK